jgi:hypothetical protein
MNNDFVLLGLLGLLGLLDFMNKAGFEKGRVSSGMRKNFMGPHPKK